MKRFVIFLSSLFACFALFIGSVYFVQAGSKCDIKITCATPDSTIKFDGEELYLYRVAKEDFTPLEIYKDIDLEMDDKLECSNKLTYIISKNNVKADITFFSGKDGIAQTELGEGIYIILGKKVSTKDKMEYSPSPLMIKIDGNQAPAIMMYMKYTATSLTKETETSKEKEEATSEESKGNSLLNKGTPTNTGDNTLFARYCYVIVAASVGIVICAIIYRKKKKS